MAKSKRALGRDFFELLDDNILASDKTNAATNLRISEVEPRADQPRKTFSTESLAQLAETAEESLKFCTPSQKNTETRQEI